MPEITLHEPSNSLFHSSLNEVDLAMREILLAQMRIADPRTKSRKQESKATTADNNWLWDYSRVFQVDDLDTDEIFDTYLLRKTINGEKDVDVSFPLLGFQQENIETVFWERGNRYKQWEFDIPSDPKTWEIGDEVTIAYPEKYRGKKAELYKITQSGDKYYCQLAINGSLITEKVGSKIVTVEFDSVGLRASGDKAALTYKAKAITCKYKVAILCDNRDEIQYIRDHFILRCADAHIWHTYASPTLKGSQNQIFTVFGVPNIERVPQSKDKISGKGWIYVTAFEIDTWACLADTPMSQQVIEAIRMNVHVENHDKINRIVVTEA